MAGKLWHRVINGKMTDLSNLDEQFYKCCFTLATADIEELILEDNGAITNVLAKIDTHCFGVKLIDAPLVGFVVENFYINGHREVKGDIIQIKLKDPNYFMLLLRFCSMLSDHYQQVDALDTFNTFQKKLRGFLEKLGFFTITNLEMQQFKGQSIAMASTAEKGIIKLEFIDKTQFYRKFFNEIFSVLVVKGLEYVYLMVNNDTSLIKIGTSKNPVYRERTLHSQEPSINLIAVWCCGKQIERKLHAKFSQKRVRGEWFRLTLTDLRELEKFMDQEMIPYSEFVSGEITQKKNCGK